MLNTSQLANLFRPSLTPWQTISFNPILCRAIEIALVADLSLRVIGNPANGATECGQVIQEAGILNYAWCSPCACGNLGDSSLECMCSDKLIARFQRRLLSHHYDINVDCPRPRECDLVNRQRCEPFNLIVQRAQIARSLFPSVSDSLGTSNAAPASLFRAASDKLAFTLQQRESVIKVARAIEALRMLHLPSGPGTLSAASIAEAVHYQSIPRRG